MGRGAEMMYLVHRRACSCCLDYCTCFAPAGRPLEKARIPPILRLPDGGSPNGSTGSLGRRSRANTLKKHLNLDESVHDNMQVCSGGKAQPELSNGVCIVSNQVGRLIGGAQRVVLTFHFLNKRWGARSGIHPNHDSFTLVLFSFGHGAQNHAFKGISDRMDLAKLMTGFDTSGESFGDFCWLVFFLCCLPCM